MSACNNQTCPKALNMINIEVKLPTKENFDNLPYISARCSKTVKIYKVEICRKTSSAPVVVRLQPCFRYRCDLSNLWRERVLAGQP